LPQPSSFQRDPFSRRCVLQSERSRFGSRPWGPFLFSLPDTALRTYSSPRDVPRYPCGVMLCPRCPPRPYRPPRRPDVFFFFLSFLTVPFSPFPMSPFCPGSFLCPLGVPRQLNLVPSSLMLGQKHVGQLLFLCLLFLRICHFLVFPSLVFSFH